MPGGPPTDDRWPFSINLDDISDVEELELPPRVAAAEAVVTEPVFATGSEIRPRVAVEVQEVPSELDMALMAYLLDIDILHATSPPESSTDGPIDETPTPRQRP